MGIRAQIDKHRAIRSRAETLANLPLDGDDSCPQEYRRVLDLLRQADRSGMWPNTSLSRARVIDVEDPTLGGTFAVGLPGPSHSEEGKIPQGNQRFPELVEAVFDLEKALAPTRIPSTMVA